MDIIEKTISNLVERQFPSFYREEGPVFVEFVKQYYKWLETSQYILDRKINLSTLNVKIGNTTVVGKNSFFEEDFVAGDRIAIFNSENTGYIISQINSISNNTTLILNDPPLVSYSNVEYGIVKDQLNPVYHSRHILEYKDVDETTEDFLVYFKEKYLKGIRFETETNIRTLIKNSLDIYRSKGTERAIDLLFRLVFGRGAEVYYPGEDIFKLSSGQWYVPKYIEVSLNDKNKLFSGKVVTGITTGAKAFVESVIRRNVKGKLVDILFVSAINGVFQSGEIVTIVGNEEILEEKIQIVGSLTNVDVDVNGVGTGFSIGQIIDLISPRGEKGKGRVAAISNVSGLIDYKLINGGYGYTSNAEVIISTKVLNISNLQISTSNPINSYFEVFEGIIQPKALINFNNATSTFTVGDDVFTYWPNNEIKGYGVVLAITANDTSTTNGTLTVAVRDGDLDEEFIYNSGNVVVARLNNTNGYFDFTTTANVVGFSSNLNLYIANVAGTFVRNDEIYQINNDDVEVANAKILTFSRTVGSNALLRVSNTKGIFSPNLAIYNRSNINYTANLVSQDIQVGIYNVNVSSFVASNGNYIYSTSTGTNGFVTFISSGSSANVSVSNDVIYEEDVSLNTDYLINYANIALDAADYGFLETVTDKDTIIDDALSNTIFTIGKLLLLVGINRGQNYDIAPYVTVYEQITKIQDKKDAILTLDGTFNFAPGELITQTSTNARGIVKENSNSSVLYVERLRLIDANNFVITTNEASKIVGVESGVSGNVQLVEIDTSSNFLGLNAIIATEVVGGNGAVTKIDVVDSGFGYSDGDEINFENEQGIATGVARLGRIGVGVGYYKQKGGFLSDQKKLFDGNYYQEYSYDILSSITLNRYEDMLKKVLHVAGTKYFSSLVYSSTVNTETNYAGNGVNITIETPGIITTESDYITFNAQSAVSSSENFITLSPQPFVDGDEVTYVLYSGNTKIFGLSDNTSYYVISSNSTGIKLAANSSSNTPIDIAAGSNESGHAFKYTTRTDLILTEKSQIISREI
jgi:hypothetical protein